MAAQHWAKMVDDLPSRRAAENALHRRRGERSAAFVPAASALAQAERPIRDFQDAMRQQRREVVVVGDEHHAVAARA